MTPLLNDLNELQTREEKLEWLFERIPEIPILEVATSEMKIKECLSNLWFMAKVENEKLFLSCRSDSKIIQGVIAFICDEFSGLEIALARTKFIDYPFIVLESLLSTNRQIGFKKIISIIESKLLD